VPEMPLLFSESMSIEGEINRLHETLVRLETKQDSTNDKLDSISKKQGTFVTHDQAGYCISVLTLLTLVFGNHIAIEDALRIFFS
jgi:hypothetical protein